MASLSNTLFLREECSLYLSSVPSPGLCAPHQEAPFLTHYRKIHTNLNISELEMLQGSEAKISAKTSRSLCCNTKFHPLISDPTEMFCQPLCSFLPTLLLSFLNAQCSLGHPDIASSVDMGLHRDPCGREPSACVFYSYWSSPAALPQTFEGPASPPFWGQDLISSSDSCSILASLVSCRVQTAAFQGCAKVVFSGENTGF